MQPLTRPQIAWRLAQDFTDGMVINLGIGLPTLCGDHIPIRREVVLQSENGVVGAGPLAARELADSDLIDAGSRRITLAAGGSVIDSVAAFAMIRGGHIHVAVLGAFEIAANGDLANWDMRAGYKGPLVGGAMDLAMNARAVWAIMEHTTRHGAPRLLERCTLPLTAPACVTRVYTDLAVIAVTPDGFRVLEIIPGLSRDMLQSRTGAKLTFAPQCGTIDAPPIGATA